MKPKKGVLTGLGLLGQNGRTSEARIEDMGERIVSLGPSRTNLDVYQASINRLQSETAGAENKIGALTFGLIEDRPYVEECFVRTFGRASMTSELSLPSLRAACPRPGIAIEYIKSSQFTPSKDSAGLHAFLAGSCAVV